MISFGRWIGILVLLLAFATDLSRAAHGSALPDHARLARQRRRLNKSSDCDLATTRSTRSSSTSSTRSSTSSTSSVSRASAKTPSSGSSNRVVCKVSLRQTNGTKLAAEIEQAIQDCVDGARITSSSRSSGRKSTSTRNGSSSTSTQTSTRSSQRGKQTGSAESESTEPLLSTTLIPNTVASAETTTASTTEPAESGSDSPARSSDTSTSTNALAADSNAASSGSASSSSSSAEALQVNASDESTTNAQELPGRSMAVLPIGLGVFAGVTVITLAIVGIVTYERRKYRAQFRSRKMAQQVAQSPRYGADGMTEIWV